MFTAKNQPPIKNHKEQIVTLKIKFLAIFAFIFLNIITNPVQAAPSAFVSGSYQQILASNANQPFMLVVWSINCSSCLKDMELLSSIHKHRPKLKIIMLAADEPSATEQIEQILAKNQLSDLENWVYSEENTQKLQYEIDPQWYGELPRTYFFNKAHQRTGVSGVLAKKDYDSMFAKILK